jgi:hypothetical protein
MDEKWALLLKEILEQIYYSFNSYLSEHYGRALYNISLH